MTYTPRLKAFDGSVKKLRRELARAEDDLVELTARDKRLAAIQSEGDAGLAAQYGMEN